MNRKIINPILILVGAFLSLFFWRLPGEGWVLYTGFFLPYTAAFLVAFGIMNYSGSRWYWKVIFSIPLTFLIGFVLMIMGMIIFTR